MMRLDLHSHSSFSKDSRSTLDAIIAAVPRSGLDALALTDHNELAGALELQKRAPFPVIAGEEIKTRNGEVIGLFLREWIPPGLSPVETVDRIHEQGAVAYVPHPFDRVRKSRMDEEHLEEIVDKVDIIEVFNARNALPRFNTRALVFAQSRGKLMGAGSDAHSVHEYGSAYVDLPAFSDARSFLEAMKQGQWRGRLSSPLVHVRTRLDVVRKRMAARGTT
jgi:predicted metal-dependent phosphoesterase TrpH